MDSLKDLQLKIENNNRKTVNQIKKWEVNHNIFFHVRLNSCRWQLCAGSFHLQHLYTHTQIQLYLQDTIWLCVHLESLWLGHWGAFVKHILADCKSIRWRSQISLSQSRQQSASVSQWTECQEVHYSQSPFHSSGGVMSGCQSVLQASCWVKSPTSHSHWQPVIQPSVGWTSAAQFQFVVNQLWLCLCSWRAVGTEVFAFNSFTQGRWRAAFSSAAETREPAESSLESQDTFRTITFTITDQSLNVCWVIIQSVNQWQQHVIKMFCLKMRVGL